MKHKYCLLASIAVFIAMFAVEFVIHGLCLSGIYEETAALWRSKAEMESMMWMMWLGYLIFAPFFVCIYSKGYEEGKSGLSQGLRFGALIGMMLAPMMALGWYAVLPMPKMLAIYWGAGSFIEYLLLGAVVGLVWKKE